MRTETQCFEGFVKMISNEYGYEITSSDYLENDYRSITKFHNGGVNVLSKIYSQAWNDAAKFYNSLS